MTALPFVAGDFFEVTSCSIAKPYVGERLECIAISYDEEQITAQYADGRQRPFKIAVSDRDITFTKLS